MDMSIHLFVRTEQTIPFEEYIEKALSLGIKEISFTEHAPLPEGFMDTTPEKDSAMDIGKIEIIIFRNRTGKKEYQGRIHHSYRS